MYNTMKQLKFFIVSIISLGIMSCSTMSTNKRAANLSAITADKEYQLRVRSGNMTLDRIIHAYASSRFGEYLKLENAGPSGNYIEIVFSGSEKHGLRGSAAAYTFNMNYGNTWYTGDDSRWLNDGSPIAESEIAAGSMFAWQKSTMTAMIRNGSGLIMWGAHYNYKGIADPSGLYVNTADEAARISLDRIINQFENDYILMKAGQARVALEKTPDISLVIDDTVPGSKEPAAEDEVPPGENSSRALPEEGLMSF